MRRLTNSPTLDVPVTVPPAMERQLLDRKRFGRHNDAWELYQTLYYRAPAKPARGEQPAIVSVSVPEPTFAHTGIRAAIQCGRLAIRRSDGHSVARSAR